MAGRDQLNLAKFGSIQFSSAQFCSTQQNSAQLSLAQFCSTKLNSAQFSTMSWVLGPESRVSGWDGGGCSGRTPIYPTSGSWAYPIQFSSVLLKPAQLSRIQLISAQFSSIQLDSAQFSNAPVPFHPVLTCPIAHWTAGIFVCFRFTGQNWRKRDIKLWNHQQE